MACKDCHNISKLNWCCIPKKRMIDTAEYYSEDNPEWCPLKDSPTLTTKDIEFEFYPNASDKLYMEDVTSIALEAFELIEKRLKKFGIKIKEGQDDDLYLPIARTIERYGNGEYRSHL